MGTESAWSTDEVTAFVAGRRVVATGFGAGPGCIAQKHERHEPSISIEQALVRLEAHRTTFRRAHVELDDGERVFFDPRGSIVIVKRTS